MSLNQWSLWSSYVGDTTAENWWSTFLDLLKKDPGRILQGELDPLDFPKLTREKYDLEAIEIEASLYYGQVNNINYFKEFKKRCEDYGVKSLFISNVWGGNLAGSGNVKPKEVAKNYYKWVDLCEFLGCHSLMVAVNGRTGDREAVKDAATEGLCTLVEYAEKCNIHIIIENHNWYSADPYWLIDIIESVNSTYCKLNVDFGNFCEYGWRNGECYGQHDPYEGVKLLMPFANAVSAKTIQFDEKGNEKNIDYSRMLKIVEESAYTGYLGIEYSGDQFSDHEGIIKTIELINRFNGNPNE